LADKKVGPQEWCPGGTDNTSREQATGTSQCNGAEQQDNSNPHDFLLRLLKLGVVIWTATPGTNQEFHRPTGWQKLDASGNVQRLNGLRPGMAVCLNTGGVVAVVDVDPRNGGDIEKVKHLLAELEVRIFGVIRSPSGGKHFYVAGHPNLPSIHCKPDNPKLPGFPGVDIQSFGCNVFLPGTLRGKYQGAGYVIEFDDIDALAEGDPLGAEALSQWVGEQVAEGIKSRAGKNKSEFDFPTVAPWPGGKPDRRQQAYLEKVLDNAVKKISTSAPGGRNEVLYEAALKCSSFVAGAGMDGKAVFLALVKAAQRRGLTGDDGQASVLATIRSAFKVGQANPRAVPDDQREARDDSRYRRIVTLTPMTHIADDVPEWAWRYDGKGHIQRGTLTLYAGRPGAGKSTALRWTAAEYSRGKLYGCWHGKPQNIAYIAGAEESLRFVVKPGLRAVGADMNRLFFPEVTISGEVARLSSLADEKALTEELLAHGITVVLVDPVMSVIGGGVDIHRNNETREYLEPWSRIAEVINGLVIGVAHLTKANNRDIVAAINGSSAFGEVPRAVFGFAKDPQSEQHHRVMSQAKNSAGYEDLSLAYIIEPVRVTTDSGKHGEVGKFTIVGNSQRTVSDILGEPLVATDTKLEEATAWLEDFLQNPFPSSDVKREARKVGFSEATIKRAASKLKVLVREADFPRRTYWLPPVGSQSDQDKSVEPTDDTTATEEG
jgi:hypothetical protein